MTEETAVTIAEIRALVGERQRYEEWLLALEAKRGDTPARVFARVHEDYVSRRDRVIANLHEHVGTLETLEKELSSRLTELETQLSDREDERAEAMLRTAVGEFDSDRWESTRHEVEASLGQLTQQRETLLAEADDTRALLNSARHRPAAPPPAPAVAPVSPPTPAQALVPEATPAPPPLPAVHDANVQGATNAARIDSEIDHAFTITDDTDSAFFQADVHDGHFTVSADAAKDEPASDLLNPEFHAAANVRDESPGATAPESLDDIDVFGESSPPIRVPSAETTLNAANGRPSWATEPATNGAATRDAFDDLAFLRSVTDTGSSVPPANTTVRQGAQGEQAKTLRCTECGTMNFPTEWYCERCGGELAAF